MDSRQEENHVEQLLTLIEGIVVQEKIPHVVAELEIHRVARMGDEEQMRHILKNKNKNVNGLDTFGNGRSALHEAAARGHLALVKDLLREKDIDVNQKSFIGKETPLHLAVFSNHRIIVFALLNHGADANRINKHGKTPLHYAQEKNIASLLCSHGASTTTEDNNHHTPLDSINASNYSKDEDLVDYLVKIKESLVRGLIQREIQAVQKDKKARERRVCSENESDKMVKEAKNKKTRMNDYQKWRHVFEPIS